jgi:hypothetical protein
MATKKKGSARAVSLSKLKGVPCVPENLALAVVTPKQLASQAYQKRLLAHFAPVAIIRALQSAIRDLDSGNASKAREQIFQAYRIIEGKSAVSLNVNQQVANVSRGSAGPSDDGQYASFEDIARVVDAEQRKRLEAPRAVIDLNAATFDPTPED